MGVIVGALRPSVLVAFFDPDCFDFRLIAFCCEAVL
jgi:hypothetical protein